MGWLGEYRGSRRLWMFMLCVQHLAAWGAPVNMSMLYVANCTADPQALSKTLDLIRREREDYAQLVTVTLHGTCRISSSLELQGMRDSNINWVGGSISGGIAVGNWRRLSVASCEGCGYIWESQLPVGSLPARQLWVGTTRANRTRQAFPQMNAAKTALGLNTTFGANWTRAEAVEMVYAGHEYCLGSPLPQPSSPNFFTWQRIPVSSAHPDHIILSATALSHIPLVPKQADLGLPCWVENVFELLGGNNTSREGDYYHDVPAQKLYYVSPTAPSSVVLPQTQTLVKLKNVTGVTFSNTTFAHSTWLFGADGYTQIQAGCTNRKDRLDAAPKDWDPATACLPTPAAVEVFNSRDVNFSGCAFRNLGTSGTYFWGGSQSSGVMGSEFDDISATAVQIGSVDSYNVSDPHMQDADITVADCRIHSVGLEYPGNCGVTAFYSRGLRILYNEIYNIPYSGISVGWGWDFIQAKIWPRMPWDADNVIEGNNIHHVMTRLGDGGMIYTLGPQGNKPFLQASGGGRVYPPVPEPPLLVLPMSQIKRNYLHHNGPASPSGGGQKAKGLYSDEGSTNWNITENVIEDNTGPNFVWMSGCRDSGVNNSWSDNSYSCKIIPGRSIGPNGRVSECCDSGCSGDSMPAAAQRIAAAAGPRISHVVHG